MVLQVHVTICRVVCCVGLVWIEARGVLLRCVCILRVNVLWRGVVYCIVVYGKCVCIVLWFMCCVLGCVVLWCVLWCVALCCVVMCHDLMCGDAVLCCDVLYGTMMCCDVRWRVVM